MQLEKAWNVVFIGSNGEHLSPDVEFDNVIFAIAFAESKAVLTPFTNCTCGSTGCCSEEGENSIIRFEYQGIEFETYILEPIFI